MGVLNSIVSAVKTVAGTAPASALIDAGSQAAQNKILDMSGFTDPKAQSPIAPIAAPTPAPDTDEKKRTIPKWIIPTIVGVLVIGGLVYADSLRARLRQ